MAKKEKSKTHKMHGGVVMSNRQMKKLHGQKKSFWNRATGGLMK